MTLSQARNMNIEARFTLAYQLIVLGVTVAMFALAWYILGIKGYGWSVEMLKGVQTLNFTKNSLQLALISLIMLAVFASVSLDIIRPKSVLHLTPLGIHDRRVTHGLIAWQQIDSLHLYKKGWQYMITIEVKPQTTGMDKGFLGLGHMPLYAFNRLCARLLKRPELNIALGGLSVSEARLIDYIKTHYKGSLVD